MEVDPTLSEALAARNALTRSYNAKIKRPVKTRASVRAMELGTMLGAIHKLDNAIEANRADTIAALQSTTEK